MATINRRLSNWDATSFCPCHTWQFQPSRGRSPEGICWERTDPATGLYIRTWRAMDTHPRTWEHVGPVVCEVCGYDLTRTPQENLKAIPAEEWSAGVIVGSCFSHEHETKVADILPSDVAIEFSGCNLDNVVLGAMHRMVPMREDRRGMLCSHNRIHRQSDGQDWICRWKANGANAEGSPVQPKDIETAIAEGRNTDPSKLPEREVGDRGIRG